MLRRTTSTLRANDACRPALATRVRRGEGGVALITTLLLVGLLTAVGLGLTMLTMVETWLGAGLRTSQALSYAADAGVNRVQVDLSQSADWTTTLVAAASGGASAFNDGATTPSLADRSTIDLVAETRRVQTASDSDYGDATANPDSPAWRLFAHGPVSDLIPGRASDSPFYLAAWIADDPSDGDRDPGADANGRLMIRATAFGSGGARRSVEATVARVGPPGFTGRPSAVSMVVWRELR
jgi:hypothetical protein